ncbi:hypothetical protein B0T25DRAFT_547055 [Lasiosphaeria hispida]|uniref:Rhodopsin domain-containing protein n=1 Tax=Lasiosphaeria hispida TaxID=260671 RepID=A0AAJ0MBY8_9PEZI|nr:hypothetical protein B0T25DRAFT_547055 [Lasiosphaeria hispida]
MVSSYCYPPSVERQTSSIMAAPNSTTEFPPGFAEESSAHCILIPVVIFFPITILLAAIRTWTRHTMTGLGAEDWVLLLALAFGLATDAMFLFMTAHGFGRHVQTVSPADLTLALRAFWLSQMTYKASLHLTKISLLLFYTRIFHHISRFRRVASTLVFLIATYLVATCIASVMQCSPVQKAWSFRTPGTCTRVLDFFIFNAAASLATDVAVWALPVPLVWGLKLPRGQKLALVPVFGLGGFVVVVAAMRLYSLAAPTAPNPDPTYDLWGTTLTIVEFNLAIVCVCLPSVRVFLVKLLPGVFPGTSVHRSTAPGSGGPHHSPERIVGRLLPSNSGCTSEGGGSVSLSAISVAKMKRDQTSSDEDMLGRGYHGGIKKTVRYDVEYGMTRYN